MSKMKVINGAGNKDEMKETLRAMRETMPTYLEYLTLTAKMTRAKYDAMIVEGFTPKEALELSKTL